MTYVSMNAKIVRVLVETGREGLYYATSRDLKGLLVAEPAYEALTKSIPDVIIALYAACNVEVEVRQADRRVGGSMKTSFRGWRSRSLLLNESLPKIGNTELER